MTPRRAAPALALMVALLAPGIAPAERTYVSSATCAWSKSTLTVQVVPSAFVQVIGNESDTINISTSRGIDGLVLLPGGAPTDPPWDAPYTRAAADAVEQWETIAHRFATMRDDAAHLADLQIDVHVLGPGVDPSALPRPDTYVIFLPHMGAWAGLNAFQSCESASDLPSCTDNTCRIPLGSNIVLSSMFVWSMTPNDIYNVTLHEFGHVLGLDHVGLPDEDLMQAVYPYQPGVVSNPRECLSTLNLAQAAENFRWMDGVTPYEPDPAGVFEPTDDYEMLC